LFPQGVTEEERQAIRQVLGATNFGGEQYHPQPSFSAAANKFVAESYGQYEKEEASNEASRES
jgi:hypothetical protein